MNSIATEFKLYENNPDQSAWLLYGMRYSVEQLKSKQSQLIGTLEMSTHFLVQNEQVAVVPIENRTLNSQELSLIEELACVNEAIDFHAAQPDIAGKGLDELLQFDPRSHFSRSNLRGNKLADFYNFIDLGLGQIIRDLLLARQENGLLTGRHKELFKNFRATRERSLKLLQGGHTFIGLPD